MCYCQACDGEGRKAARDLLVKLSGQTLDVALLLVIRLRKCLADEKLTLAKNQDRNRGGIARRDQAKQLMIDGVADQLNLTLPVLFCDFYRLVKVAFACVRANHFGNPAMAIIKSVAPTFGRVLFIIRIKLAKDSIDVCGRRKHFVRRSD